LRIATDNPLGAALLALVQAAAHPGDTLAQEHLRMTPLGAVLAERGLGTPEALTRRLLGQIHAHGFERTMESWTAALEPRLDRDDAFSRLRSVEFATAAGAFDRTGSRDVGEFIAFMERYTMRAPEGAAIVRVMTIHKAKGLGFDVVLLPDLEGYRLDERRAGLAVQKAPDRTVQWVLDLPPKLFYTQDDVLAAHVRTAEAEACYENLSLLYVALTRAKRSLYVITERVGDSKSRNYPRLLANTLGETSRAIRVGEAEFNGSWVSGDPDWHRAIAPEPPDRIPEARAPRPLTGMGGRARHWIRVPSDSGAGEINAGSLFALQGRAAAERGIALHAALALVEWATPAEADRWVTVWKSGGHNDDVVIEAGRCLRATGLAPVWQKPDSPAAEVWRERAFEVVLDGAWTTGVFDRVVIEKGPDGRPTAATVYDFKTDRVAGEADFESGVHRYHEQLQLYRRVAGLLTGLCLEKVTSRLVFTNPGRVVAIG
jgi:hypothetical protein